MLLGPLLPILAAIRHEAPNPAPIRVMILGVYHLANPGMDLHNLKADSPLTPKRQAELADLVDRLARFRPTKVAIESVGAGPELFDAGFARFTPADLAKDPNEATQIGYRLAARLDLSHVYGIDERGDYFPYDAVAEFAKSHGEQPLLDGLGASIQRGVEEAERTQDREPIRRVLALFNDPKKIERTHDEFYYGLLRVGDATKQPGAELNARWYERNAKIFTKLTQVAKPGDRVVVVFGGGHAYWLRHFAKHTPGFRLEESIPYLR